MQTYPQFKDNPIVGFEYTDSDTDKAALRFTLADGQTFLVLASRQSDATIALAVTEPIHYKQEA